MPKHKKGYTCPHCSLCRPTAAGVRRHIANARACSRKEDADYKKRTKTRLGRANLQPDWCEPPPPPPPPSPPPSPPEIPDVPDVDMEDARREGNCRVTIEELPDEPLLQTLRPAHRSSSVIEEVPDLFEIPMCAHPFATPTRPSLFPEPYLDRRAGQAIRFEELAAIPPPLYDTSLTDPDVFREAYWLGTLPISEAKANEYFSLPRTSNWHWKNFKEFEREIDSLPHGPSWYRQTVRVQTDNGFEILDLWKRNVVEVIQMLIRDRRFVENMRFAPERHWTSEDRDERVYDEMWSGDWWWKIQNMLREGATIAPVILAADKTRLSVLAGNTSAWPVYLSIGNIGKDTRRKASERAMLLVGYIPVTDLADINDPEARRQRKWQVFHTCMESILEPLKQASVEGVYMRCADGGIRRVHPILAAHQKNRGTFI
ncbi:hypothetical protein FRC09_014208 [Ceratobasidium sp. 395]|nr:hypothetical protein FRC09_014208 [Ceratobasidium sp. 395]